MPKLRVHNFTISTDGYGAGPDQSLEFPMGTGAEALHEWMFKTAFWQRMVGADVTVTPGVDDEILDRGEENIGAHIMGRHMFTHSRGEWPNDDWTGWWGPNPPYHHPVFVLTHYPHEPIEMEGGTTFHFVTEGIESALELAFEAAGGQDVRIGGGASTVQQYLRAGLVDELHIAISPVLLGGGERLFDGVPNLQAQYEIVEMMPGTSPVTHVRMVKKQG